MSEIDPNKMKVVELRAELAARNLDTKGNKAVLVKRLKIALNKETGNLDASGDDGADMSMDADASLEDSQLIDDDGQSKEEPELNSGAGEAYVPEEPTTEDESQTKEEEEEESNDLQDEECEGGGDQEMKDEEEEEEEEKKENSEENQLDGETDTKEQQDSAPPPEEPQNKQGEKRKRSRSPNDKTRHRSHSRNRDHSRRHSRDRSHYRSRSKSPAKIETEPEEPFDDTLVSLDKYNSDLHLQIDKTRYSAQTLTTAAFVFMWAGARSSYGVKNGKICFETKITKHMDVNLPADEQNPHIVRVGFSIETSSMQLGEEPLSYGYDGTGKSCTKSEFKEYGNTFGEGDVITSFLNMEEDPIQISFAKNGNHEGLAFEIPKEELEEQALFPHILTKNCSFEVNFGQNEEPSFPLPEGYDDYKFISTVPLEERERGMKPPEKREDCEIILMCGLPGSGKTTWALKHAEENPEKRYNILGTNSLIERMKVMGLPRRKNYSGRWDVLIEKSTRSVNKLLDMGARTLRNFIYDQTNVYASAQRRKMRPFEGFKRKAVVIVPTDEEFKRRCEKQEKEEGKDVPDHAVMEMKANFTLPQPETVFDEIIFTELSAEEAEPVIRKYNEEGRKAAPPPKRFRQNDRSRGPPPRGPPGRRGGYGGNPGWGSRPSGSGGYRGPASGGRGGAIPLRVSENRSSRNKKGMYGGPRPRGPPGGHRGHPRGPPGGGGGNRQRRGGSGYNYNQGQWNQGQWKSGGSGYYNQQGYGGSYPYHQQWSQQPYYQQNQGYGQGYYNQGYYHQGYGGYGQK